MSEWKAFHLISSSCTFTAFISITNFHKLHSSTLPGWQCDACNCWAPDPASTEGDAKAKGMCENTFRLCKTPTLVVLIELMTAGATSCCLCPCLSSWFGKGYTMLQDQTLVRIPWSCCCLCNLSLLTLFQLCSGLWRRVSTTIVKLLPLFPSQRKRKGRFRNRIYIQHTTCRT